MAFHLGLKPKPSKNGLPSYAPFSREQHWTRYQFLITLDLDVIKGPVLKGLLTSLLGLQVGGGHSASLMELSPCMMAWRFHKVRGQSGLYFGLGVSFPPDKPVDLAPLKERERTLGIKFQYAGSESEMSIRDGIDAMLAEAT
jgi:hypothetical protein